MSLFDEAKRIREKMLAEDELRVAIGLFGQPGAGKSALINRLVGVKLAPEGVKNDVTRERQEYQWNGLTLVDLPGFDTAEFPADSYLSRFPVMELDLLLCVFAGKFHTADSQFFREVTKRGKACLFVCNKHDTLWQEGKESSELEREITESVAAQVGSPQQIYFTSCRLSTGLNELETAVKVNLDPAKQDRWVRAAKAYTKEFLNEKKHLCNRRVLWSAGISAAAAAIPIPGTDVAVDVGVLVSLFKYLRDTYGLTEKVLETTEMAFQTLAPIANEIIGYATSQGVMLLLKQFVGKKVLEQASKYIPFVGPVIAASLGFALTRQAGLCYLEKCHQIAEAFLGRQLNRG